MKTEQLLIAVENMREAINENNTVFLMKEVEELLQEVVEHLADCSDTELM